MTNVTVKQTSLTLQYIKLDICRNLKISVCYKIISRYTYKLQNIHSYLQLCTIHDNLHGKTQEKTCLKHFSLW